ncbi:MAG: Smr/MutS family protein [Hyphomicrobiaceae bacterium]|nr:Smr/MutS family protein [Hyphomicrobiaceae bacterium]MCC0023896.1 Smr/MutS family protein [Hyphomicrobiaceae bacterium]
MSKRNRPGRPAINDWHLWTEVTRSVSPLKRRDPEVPPTDVAETEETTQNLPKKPGPVRDGGKLFRNRPAGGGEVWAPGATPIHHHLPDKQHPNRTIEPRTKRRVRRGQIPIDARLDLHGLRQDEARAALHHFIDKCVGRGDRTVLVITGKGLKKIDPSIVFERGVLRHLLPHWLNEPSLAPLIAGYEVSAQHHGGEGAYYVRLKRIAPGNS